jgi:hypothetical protein
MFEDYIRTTTPMFIFQVEGFKCSPEWGCEDCLGRFRPAGHHSLTSEGSVSRASQQEMCLPWWLGSEGWTLLGCLAQNPSWSAYFFSENLISTWPVFASLSLSLSFGVTSQDPRVCFNREGIGETDGEKEGHEMKSHLPAPPFLSAKPHGLVLIYFQGSEKWKEKFPSTC